MDLELGPTCLGGMPSNSQPPSPSHRNPLALLSKLRHQLSKSPSTQHRRRHSHKRNRSHLQQPIEHQYLPIPAVSFAPTTPESRAQSTYSCSNKSSSGSSFVFIDHNEGPESFDVDEYRPFLPLIIQHERRLAAAAAVATITPPPPLLHSQGQQGRIHEPPSPTSTASSKSPITPIFASACFRNEDDEDVDEIVTLSSSEVGSISEYSLPRSLSAYVEGARSIRSRRGTKSSSGTNSESESRRGRVRGMSVRTIPLPPSSYAQQRPLHRHPSKKLYPPAPISPPPSGPLPEPPVSARPRSEVVDTIIRADAIVTATATAARTTDVRPDSAIFTMEAPLVLSDSGYGSSQIPWNKSFVDSRLPAVLSSTGAGQSRGRSSSASATVGLRKEVATSASAPVQALSPAICPHTKSKLETESSMSILADLETSHSTSTSNSTSMFTFVSASTSSYHEFSTSANREDLEKHQKEKADDDDDDDSNSFATCTSTYIPTTPTTPTPTPTRRHYGIGRQVIRGSGCDFKYDFQDSSASSRRNSKRTSSSSKREGKNGGMEKRMRKEENRSSITHESVLDLRHLEDGDGGDGERLDKPGDDDVLDLDLDFDVEQDRTTPTQSQSSTRTPIPRRRVKSNDTTSPSVHPSTTSTSGGGSRRIHRDKHRERMNPEWTLFLGIPRNAPPVSAVLPVDPGSVSSSSSITPLGVEPSPNPPSHAGIPALASIPLSMSTPAPLHPTMERRSDPTTTTTKMMRNRTKSDSALLARAASVAAAANNNSDGSTNTKHAKSKTKPPKRVGREEDWTLSLPLVTSSVPLPPTPLPPPAVSCSSSSVLAYRGSGSGERGRGSKCFEASPVQAVMVGAGAGTGAAEEFERGVDGEVGVVGVEDSKTGLFITVEDVDCQQRNQRGVRCSGEKYEDEKREDEVEEGDQNSLTLRVPRIVQSCSSSPFLSTSTHTNTHVHRRIKKGSSRWMGATSTPDLRTRAGGGVERLSSSTLEEEVMLMLLGDGDNSSDAAEEEKEQSKKASKSKSRKDLATATVLAQKKTALDEDLVRFNALLKNGNGNGSRPSSTVLETAVAMMTTTTTTKTKMKVTLNSNPISTPTATSTPQKSIAASSQTLPIKPVLKHAKSCEPFLESHSSGVGVVHPPSPPPPSPPHMSPVMRFPSSTRKGDLNFFDELGDGHRGLRSARANLRLTKSAERIMGESGNYSNLLSTTLTTTASLPPATIPSTSTCSTSSPPQPSPPLLQRTARTPSSSSISPPNLTSSTQTLLLPFASTPSSLSFSSASASASLASLSVSHNIKYPPPSTFNLKLKGGSVTALGSSGVGVEVGGGGVSARKGVPMPLRTSSIKAVSMGSLKTSIDSVESTLGIVTSHKPQKEREHQQHRKQGVTSTHLPPRLHTSSLSSSSSSSSSTLSSSQRHRHHITINRRSITPPLPPSPICSESEYSSSSALPTPLASSFPLPPSSVGISGFDTVVAFQQKLREYKCAREKHHHQQQQQQPGQQQQLGGNQNRSYRPPSTASSIASLISNASSTATVVPSGDQKLRTCSNESENGSSSGGGAQNEREYGAEDGGAAVKSSLGLRVQEGERYGSEDDENSMCSGTYYSARSSFSS